jgi:hypothetical protein
VSGAVTPRIAHVTTCKGRLDHLKKTLPKNLTDDYPNAVYVVLDYDSQDDLIHWANRFHKADLDIGRLVIYTYRNGHMPFHISHAKNMASRCGILEGADVLVTMDADNYGGPGFSQYIANAFINPGWLRPGIFMCPNYALIKSLPHGALRPARGYAGRLAIWTSTFIKMGGYDEAFATWGREDICLNFRLQRSGYAMRYIPNEYLNAINHNAEVRFKEYPEAQALYENGDQVDILKARKETVVNYGRFGMGTVYRNFDPTPIKLSALPTRVFGIGLHKTATTSLHEAFKILGLDSLHWGTGETPLIWYEMNALGRSNTLEQFYALSDLPIPLLYQKLDSAYPNSKFILTIRNEVDWLMSVKKLWDFNHNPTRNLWEIYPISHQLHTALYGQKDFDALIFLERYRRHNAEVREYFKDRNDLLVMDMDRPRWSNLCSFLDKPIPNVPYPCANRSTLQDCNTTE